MLKQKKEEILFMTIILSYSLLLLAAFGSQGLVLVAWSVLSPLYLFRLVLWGSWDSWCRNIYRYASPRSWRAGVFTLWTAAALLILQARPHILLHALQPGPFFQAAGFLLSLGGLALTFWTLWLLGMDRAILTEVIFPVSRGPRETILDRGPFALTPHPMFLGEKLIIAGAFLVTGELSLAALLGLALLADTVAARGEEGDLRKKAGRDYASYRQKFSTRQGTILSALPGYARRLFYRDRG